MGTRVGIFLPSAVSTFMTGFGQSFYQNVSTEAV